MKMFDVPEAPVLELRFQCERHTRPRVVARFEVSVAAPPPPVVDHGWANTFEVDGYTYQWRMLTRSHEAVGDRKKILMDCDKSAEHPRVPGEKPSRNRHVVQWTPERVTREFVKYWAAGQARVVRIPI